MLRSWCWPHTARPSRLRRGGPLPRTVGSTRPPTTANTDNNGSARPFGDPLHVYQRVATTQRFAGINANTPFFNTTIGLAMLSGRFLM